MSENQSLPTSSDSPLGNSANNMNSAQEASESDANPSIDAQTNDWEVAPIPGTIERAQLSANFEQAAAGKNNAHKSASSAPVASGREAELIVLIHDLNQCNDVLLARMTQMESALEKSQTALKDEVANAQVTAGKMAQQVSVEQASAQQISYNAQQQIAKLVGELDNTEQALSRQLLINENLQTEVSNYQERISQLERECTMMAQQHLEEVQVRSQAEAATKDLRSRLQRQQRYTMQFKAALEKSLTVTAMPSDAAVAKPIAFKDSTAVVMPKAQRIMPWVSDNSSPFAGIDPHLESLIRRVGKSEAQAEEVSAIAQREAAKSLENVTNIEAEAKLWQDLERVISHTERGVANRVEKAVIEKTVDTYSSSRSDELIDDAPVVIPEQLVDILPASQPVTEPAPVAGLEITAQANGEDAKAASVFQEMPLEDDLIRQIESSFAAANRHAPEEAIGFTEPSPWGKPLPKKLSETQLDKKLEKLANRSKTQQVSGSPEDSSEDSYLPAADSKVDPAVAPLVRSLRSQKQPGSLSNVKLPTFRNAKVASFRR